MSEFTPLKRVILSCFSLKQRPPTHSPTRRQMVKKKSAGGASDDATDEFLLWAPARSRPRVPPLWNTTGHRQRCLWTGMKHFNASFWTGDVKFKESQLVSGEFRTFTATVILNLSEFLDFTKFYISCFGWKRYIGDLLLCGKNRDLNYKIKLIGFSL